MENGKSEPINKEPPAEHNKDEKQAQESDVTACDRVTNAVALFLLAAVMATSVVCMEDLRRRHAAVCAFVFLAVADSVGHVVASGASYQRIMQKKNHTGAEEWQCSYEILFASAMLLFCRAL
ncbi:hypothetical protein DQ04_19251010 [Trypanosoma grayi]|uniref:hypothetical protein n=1 Tax=Trypanosoma grayi TaxID=71804 RepID=UPI0004F44422|nr:hypothetical protein DQ04_19251010 [Trypanosoma grayi]KEG05693.1 hypothetical protein DQ04_19251010 [Trypanosoma grayi]